jgi:O-antigen ligase
VSLHHLLLGAFVLGLGTSITLAQAALALLAVRWLWRLRDPAARRAPPLLGPVLAFAGVTALSALTSGAAGPSFLAAKSTLLAVALFVVADILDGPADADRFLSVVMAVTTVAAALGLLQVAVCPGQGADYGWPGHLYHRCHRARGFFSIYMTLAGALVLVLLTSLPRVLARRLRGAELPSWLVMLAALLATFTRGAWLGFVAGVVVLAVMLRRGRLVLLGGLLLLAAGALAGPSELRHRVQATVDPAEEGVRERLFMWQSGVAIWRERPWLGAGPGGVKRLYGGYALRDAVKQRTGHVHSAPLQILVERGLLGFAVWIWVWVAFYVRAVAALRALPPSYDPRARRLTLGSIAAVTGFLVAGLSEYNFGDSEVVLLAWTVMALPFVATRPERGLTSGTGPSDRAGG